MKKIKKHSILIFLIASISAIALIAIEEYVTDFSVQTFDNQIQLVSWGDREKPADCSLVSDGEGCKSYPTNCGGGGWGAVTICKVFCESGHSFSCKEN